MIKNSSKNIIVLAYSGGLDTSAIIPWIKENFQYNVIAFVADIGQSKNDLLNIEKKAISSGAIDCYVSDLKEEFVRDYVYPMLRTGCIYEGNYLLGTAIARPLIAKAQSDFANSINAIGVSHGATGKGNDQVRFELTYASLIPHLKIIAPWREWHFKSREELLKYLHSRNIPTTATLEKIYSKDENVFHISTEGGVLENPWNPSNEDCWEWTKDPKCSPDIPEKVFLQICQGNVVSVNKEKLSPFNCLRKLNKLGAKHGIGRIDIVENRLVGMKSRGCYETPGGTIIYHALKSLEQLVLDRESMSWKQKIGWEMASLIYEGKWFTPLRKSLQVGSDILSDSVTGDVVVELYKGSVNIIQKRSPNTLYSMEYATFGTDTVYNHSDAQGFIRLFSLSSKIRSLRSFKK